MSKTDYPVYSEYLSIKNLIEYVDTKEDELGSGNVRIVNDKPQMDFLKELINIYRKSDKVETMEKSMRYYKNDTDILNAKRYFIGADGSLVEDTSLSNATLNHPIIFKTVNQKVSFLLSKPFSIQSVDEEHSEILTLEDIKDLKENKDIEDSKGVKFSKLLSKHYFDKHFIQKLKNIGRDAVINGVSWVYVHYNKNQKLVFDRIPATNVIPFYKDNDMQELQAVCYFYDQVIYTTDTIGNLVKKTQTKVEFFDDKGIWHYVIDGDNITHDGLREYVVSPHFELINTVTQERESKVWKKIPFIPFRDNWLEIPIVTAIGNLVDEYDKITSTVSNLLNDIPNSIIVVKNYSGQDKTEFTTNLALYRSIFIRDDGDAKFLQNEFTIDNFETHLVRLKRDIYEGSATVDTQETSLGNASGVALKFRLMDLDVACDDMGNEFETGLDSLISFILEDMQLKKLGDFKDVEYDIIFNTNMIINDEEATLNVQRMNGILPKRLLFENAPQVINTNKAEELDQQEWLENLRRRKIELNLIGDDMEESLSSGSKNFGSPRNAGSNIKDTGDTPKSKSPREVKKATSIKVSEPKQ